MKQLLLLILLCSFGSSIALIQPKNADEKFLVVVTASYNNVKWYKDNVDSVLSQQGHENWHWIYVDDASPDGTGERVERYVAQKGMESHVTLIKNKKRVGALANQFKATYMVPDDAVILILDGDDRFAHNDVFKIINEVYSNEDVWFTYGQFRYMKRGQVGECKPFPQKVIDTNTFRKSGQPSHLRTYYAGLFKRVQLADLMLKGDFFKMSNDIATLYPMIEMARHHFKFISTILYDYNDMNELNNHRLNWKYQFANAKLIKQRAPYDTIESPFWYPDGDPIANGTTAGSK